jgi:alkyl hydroperoxide reductase subunit AhpC
MVVILFSNDEKYIVANFKKVEHREIPTPKLTYTIRGPQDCFNENLDVNLSLIRYRLKDKNMQIKMHEVGTRTKARAAVIHIQDIANDTVVTEIEKRIQSIDSNPSHLAWTYAIYVTTGIPIPFPVIADRMGDVARLYGMIAPDASKQETVRNVFFIDPDQIIRAILVYPLTNGRSIPEILRLLTALQITDSDHVVTPANWQPGQPALVPAPKTYEELIARQNNPTAQNLNCEDWYWCYKQLPSGESQ